MNLIPFLECVRDILFLAAVRRLNRRERWHAAQRPASTGSSWSSTTAATLLVEDVSRGRAGAGTVFVIDGDWPVKMVENPDDPPSTLALAEWLTNLNTVADIERVNGRLDGA